MLRRVVWIAAVVAATTVSGVALADAPRKGARYTGRTSQHRRVSARVTSDGRTFQFRFNQISTCNNGRRRIGEARYVHQAPTIMADGTFSYHKVYKDAPGIPGLNEVHTEDQTVTGAFSDGGRRVRATLKETVTARSGLRCRSRVTFTATATAASA
jgi:hypothetical protein